MAKKISCFLFLSDMINHESMYHTYTANILIVKKRELINPTKWRNKRESGEKTQRRKQKEKKQKKVSA